MNYGKHGQGTHSIKMGTYSSAENTPNAPKFICPNCLPKPKSLGFWWKRLHWVSLVRDGHHLHNWIVSGTLPLLWTVTSSGSRIYWTLWIKKLMDSDLDHLFDDGTKLEVCTFWDYPTFIESDYVWHSNFFFNVRLFFFRFSYELMKL